MAEKGLGRFGDAARRRAQELRETARQTSLELGAAAREAAGEFGAAAREGMTSAGRAVTPEHRAGLKRVAVMAAPFAPLEIAIPAAAVAAIIKIADQQGLLESEAAAPLKALARTIDEVSPVDLEAAVPKLMELDIVRKVMGDGVAAKRIRTIAKSGVATQVVRSSVKRLRGTDPPGASGLR